MELKFSQKNNIETIREAYRFIERKWLRMQYWLMLALAVFTTLAEVLMFFILRDVSLITSEPSLYLAKYLLAPSVCNAALVLTAALAMRSGKMPSSTKSYVLSFAMVVMAFVIYSVHAVFPSLFVVFLIPMVVTVVYGDQWLTGSVAAACLLGKTLSDLFVRWDPERSRVLSGGLGSADFGLSLMILTVVYAMCAVMIVVEREKSEVALDLERERKRYQMESVTDQLTRVWNRQALREMFRKMEEERKQVRYFLAMMDLDDFKNLNDTYGHSQGDRYLRAMGAVLQEMESESVVPFRFGGDEFCVVFRDCGMDRVCTACRTIQECFARTEVNQLYKAVSVSIGVAEFREKEPPAQLLDRADAALYRAKQQKGSICIEEQL